MDLDAGAPWDFACQVRQSLILAPQSSGQSACQAAGLSSESYADLVSTGRNKCMTAAQVCHACAVYHL